MTKKSPIAKYRAENDGMTLEAFGLKFKPPVDKSTVLRWEKGKVTPERALEIEKRTGISRHALRPDIFGKAPVAEAAE